jgi:hypothetical protein
MCIYEIILNLTQIPYLNILFLRNDINFIVSLEGMTRLRILNEGQLALTFRRERQTKSVTWKFTQMAEPVICNTVTVRF